MLEGDNINLRAMEKEDIPLYHKWSTKHKEFGEYSPLRENSKYDLEQKFNQLGDEVKMFLMEKKDGTPIGTIMYFMVRALPYNLLEIGYFIIPSERNKGYTTEALKILVDYLFLSKEIVRVQACTAEGNIVSQKVLEKAGFTKEGIIRKMMFVRGKWRNGVFFSILRDEWKEPKTLII